MQNEERRHHLDLGKRCKFWYFLHAQNTSQLMFINRLKLWNNDETQRKISNFHPKRESVGHEETTTYLNVSLLDQTVWGSLGNEESSHHRPIISYSHAISPVRQSERACKMKRRRPTSAYRSCRSPRTRSWRRNCTRDTHQRRSSCWCARASERTGISTTVILTHDG